jgi:Uma2 family endonuclease
MDMKADPADLVLIGTHSNGMRMSAREFDALPPETFDEEYRYELINEVLVVNSIPLEEQAEPNELLGYWLRRYQEEHPQGKALDRTLPERYIHLPNSRRLADRVLWCGLGRRPNPRTDVPAIAVEFVSEGRRNWTRDYIEKKTEYMAVGVKEYWIVDRFARTLTVSTPAGERVIGEHELYTTPLLPGFELNLAKLLAAADEWSQE